MKQNVFLPQFRDAFKSMGRQDQFSYDGKKALFAYLEEYEESTGEEIELDVVSLCCDYAECSIEEFRSMYSLTPEDEIIEWANDHTQVVYVNDDTIMYQQF